MGILRSLGAEENVISTNGGGLIDTAANAPTCSTNFKKNGSYSYRFYKTSASACYFQDGVSGSPSSICASFYLYFTTRPAADSILWRCNATAANPTLTFIASTNKFTFGFAGVGTNTTSATFSTGVWYRIDIKVNSAAGTQTFDIQIDGNAETQYSTTSASSTYTSITFGNLTSTTYDLYMDDLVWATSDMYPIGEHQCKYLYPNADGTHNAGTNTIEAQDGTDIGTTTAYDKLNSVPPSSTTYIKQVTQDTTKYAEIDFGAMTSGYTPLGVEAYLAYTSAATQSNAASCYGYWNSTEYVIWGTSGTRADYSDGSTSNLYFKSTNPAITLNETNVNAFRVRLGHGADINPVPYWIDVWLVVVEVPPSNPTGNLTKTLDNATLSGAGKVDVVGATSATLDNAITNPASGLTSPTGIFFATGAEEQVISTNGLGLWDGTTGSPTISATQKKNGSYAFYMMNAGAANNFCYRAFNSTEKISASFYIYFVSLPAAYCNLWGFPAGASPTPTFAFERSGGNPYLYYGFSGKGAKFGTTQLATGQWYLIDVKVYNGSGTQTIDVKINGVDQGQYTRTDSQGLMGGFNMGVLTAIAHEVYYDDVVLADESFYPLGEHVCEYLAPSSDGTHNAGTNIIEAQDGTDIGATTAYDKINSTPTSAPSATTYIKQSATGASNYAEVNMSDMTSGATPYGLLGFLAYTSSGTSANTGATYAYWNSTEYPIWGDSTTPKDMSDGSTGNLYYKSAKIPITLSETNVNDTKLRLGHSTDVADVPYWIDAWFIVVRSPANPTGNLTKTLDNATLSGAGTVGVIGTLSKTLDNATLSGVGKVDVAGNLTKILDDVTLSGTASLENEGDLTKVLDNLTLSGTGSITSTVTGNLTKTLDNATLSGTGKIDVSGTLSKTLDNVTLSGSGQVPEVGSLTKTLDNVTLSGSGTIPLPSTLSKTLDDVTLSGIGKVDTKGTLSKTLDNLTLTGDGIVTSGPVGSLSKTLDNATLSGTGKATVSGTLEKTLDNVTLSGTGKTDVKASLSQILGDATLSGIGKVDDKGNLSQTLDNVTLSGTGKVDTKGTLAKTLDNVTLSGTAVVVTPGSTVTGTATISLENLVLSGTGNITFATPTIGISSGPSAPYRKRKQQETIAIIVATILYQLEYHDWLSSWNPEFDARTNVMRGFWSDFLDWIKGDKEAEEPPEKEDKKFGTDDEPQVNEIWILGDNENHCPKCLEYADMGWMPLGFFPEPGTEVAYCGDACHCKIEYSDGFDYEMDRYTFWSDWEDWREMVGRFVKIRMQHDINSSNHAYKK